MPSRKQLIDIIAIQTDIARLGLDLGSVMALVVERTLPLIDADGAVIELAEGDDMVYRATSGMARQYLGLRLKRGASLSGLCVATGTLLRCDDSETDPRVDREACRTVGLRSMIVMPLVHRDTVVGVFKAMSAQPGKFLERDETLLALLSDVIAAAMFYATKLDHDALFYKATHDCLTELANRSLFMDHLRRALASSERGGQPTAVLMIDMDGLKQINDTFGHRVGDAVLREFALRLRSISRESDTVARLGGDEFGLILTPIERNNGIEAAISRLEAALTAPLVFEERAYALRASIGAARFPDDSANLDELLETADRRMYLHKQARRSLETAGLH